MYSRFSILNLIVLVIYSLHDFVYSILLILWRREEIQKFREELSINGNAADYGSVSDSSAAQDQPTVNA